MSKEDGSEQGPEIPRRALLRCGGAAAAAVAAGVVAARAVATPEATAQRPSRRLAMAIDLHKCTGCNACAVACKAENGVRLGGFRAWVSEKESGAYPTVRRTFLPRLCNHCESPPCLDVCPTGATFKRSDGIVAIDKDKCIGCRHCMGACPYHARYFNPTETSEPGVAFPSRTPGTVDKCDFCAHRVENGVTPACINTCPVGARTFGDLDEPKSVIAQLLSKANARRLLPRFGTRPKVLYFGGDLGIFQDPERASTRVTGEDRA